MMLPFDDPAPGSINGYAIRRSSIPPIACRSLSCPMPNVSRL